MEVEAGRRDASALDPELLQLPDLAPGALRENSSIADALYAQWLVLPETSKLRNVVNDMLSTRLAADSMTTRLDRQ